MPVISINAHHFDGFSPHLLHWSLEVRSGEGRVEAEWFDYGAPEHKGRRVATFPFPTDWIPPLFDAFAALESDYDAPITDCQNQELTVRVDHREKHCQVYAGDLIVREHPEVGAFFRLWNPIQQAVLQTLDLPFRPAVT